MNICYVISNEVIMNINLYLLILFNSFSWDIDKVWCIIMVILFLKLNEKFVNIRYLNMLMIVVVYKLKKSMYL